MIILAHRGLWKSESEKNTMACLKKALQFNFGIETDLRDYQEELVISHNIAEASSPKLEDFFQYYASLGIDLPLALNVKADGMQWKLKELLGKYQISNYFLFDMSVPEMVVNQKEHLKFFTRHSDIESECVLYEKADGVWLDSFYKENWPTEEVVRRHLSDNKKISVISPEIHGFPYLPLWEMLKKNRFHEDMRTMLCTDLPEEARRYFEI